MDHDIATASVSLARIKGRQLSNLSYRAIRKFLAPGTFSGTIDSIQFLPTVASERRLGDLLNRAAWYFPRSAHDRLTIRVPVTERLLDLSIADLPVPDAQGRYLDDSLPVVLDDGPVDTDADALLVHEDRSRVSPAVLRNLARVHIVDPSYYSSVESAAWQRVSRAVRTHADEDSAATYADFESRADQFSDSYVFATGPSLDEALEYDIPDDALKIVCNSIVKNDELVERIDPDVLVFADPVFHFGPSRYAERFRQDAVGMLRDCDCIAVVPRALRGLLVERYPDLADQVVGMRRADPEPRVTRLLDSVQSRTRDFIYPDSTRLEVTPTGNIMTLFMLPIASALTETIHIIGADGRQEDESYFWEHSDTAQYDDALMNTAAETHPSFFRDRVYTDYYDRHVDVLTEMLEDGERHGREYHCLTPSYIQCLQERRFDPSDLGIVSAR